MSSNPNPNPNLTPTVTVTVTLTLNPKTRWRSLWVYPDDPTCADGFDPESTSAWEEKPIFFYSPSSKWPHLGIRTPCARHGWSHVDHVTVQDAWHIRLVRGVFGEFGLAYQRCRCATCRKEHDEIKVRRDAARSAGADYSALEAQLKAASFSFITIDSRVVRYWFERVPWLAGKMPAFVTARAAVSIELLWMILRAFPKGHSQCVTLRPCCSSSARSVRHAARSSSTRTSALAFSTHPSPLPSVETSRG